MRETPYPEIDGIGSFPESLRFAEPLNSKDMPQNVRQILSFIHQHLCSPGLNVQQLKRSCQIGDNNISSRFRQVVGVTIKDYIESLRMEVAARLLRKRSVSIYEIAQSVGYDNPQTFYRAFERRFHCTPATYRSVERRAKEDGERAVAPGKEVLPA